MFSNLSLSLAAALALSAPGAARTAASPTKSDARPRSSTNDEINALETGNPHSVEYRNRVIPSHSPTNDEINALETGNPHSVDYGNRAIPRHSRTNDEINAGETGNPHSVDSNKGQ
jgi:hypothetical protein